MKNREINFSNQASKDTLTLFFYDDIGGPWGIWASDVAQVLQRAGQHDNLAMRFHSDGGNVQEAAAIKSLINARNFANVTSYIDGRAFSAATYLALTASRIEMSDLGLWMVHKVRVGAQNATSAELRQAADAADSLEQSLIELYAEKTGASVEQVTDWVNGSDGADGTVFTASQALDAGFVDEIISQAKMEELPREFENRVTESIQNYQVPSFMNHYCKPPDQKDRLRELAKKTAVEILDLIGPLEKYPHSP